MKFQTILAGFIAQRGAAANGAVKLRLKQPEPAVFTESYHIVVTSLLHTRHQIFQFRGSFGSKSKKLFFF